MSDAAKVFSEIYQSHAWGGESPSGPGSDPQQLKEYRRVIMDFLRKDGIRTVLDVGCGDWAFSQQIDWSAVDYTGADVVPDLVRRLSNAFTSNKIRFIHLDLVEDPLPPADLCLCKDVLQHLSNASVTRFLQKLTSFRRAILTNDWKTECPTGWRRLWRMKETARANTDIPDGGWRPLRLTEEPFRLKAKRLTMIRMNVGLTVFNKEVLLWER
jgi:SAM-dependent methyltransferase